MKRIEIDISNEAYTQMEGMCAALNTTPEALFNDEVRGIWGRLQMRYSQHITQQQATNANVRIVPVDAEE
jgi:hypothetical protein